MRETARDGDLLPLATSLAQIFVLGLPLLGAAYLLFTLTWRPLKAAWRLPVLEARLAGVLAMIGAIVFVGYTWANRLPIGSQTPPVGVKSFHVSSNAHVRGHIAYPQSPPVGGKHNPVQQNCGFYDKQIRNENGVHSLEHGAVWITYRPGLPARQVESLRSLAKDQSRVLVSPYPGLGHLVIASAWGRQLSVNSAYDARIDRFVEVFRNSSNAPDAGGPCSGGKGTPR